ncbi:hypothetical protein HOLleu_28932 [Holothuria leucospilota]|uniref:CUB domain-containing protein n=1 Tax=Holothuria leucospilota TaxID=206669 RepID=A0A9Q1H2A5_HOLLE|nr:hypothetical protein HOLleu_28932 [Holothuria leucospilota]
MSGEVPCIHYIEDETEGELIRTSSTGGEDCKAVLVTSKRERFKIKFDVNIDCSAGCNRFLSGGRGSLKSPGYPDDYKSNKIKDLISGRTHKWCGNQRDVSALDFTSDSFYIKAKFVSDNNREFAGYYASFKVLK